MHHPAVATFSSWHILSHHQNRAHGRPGAADDWTWLLLANSFSSPAGCGGHVPSPPPRPRCDSSSSCAVRGPGSTPRPPVHGRSSNSSAGTFRGPAQRCAKKEPLLLLLDVRLIVHAFWSRVPTLDPVAGGSRIGGGMNEARCIPNHTTNYPTTERRVS